MITKTSALGSTSRPMARFSGNSPPPVTQSIETVEDALAPLLESKAYTEFFEQRVLAVPLGRFLHKVFPNAMNRALVWRLLRELAEGKHEAMLRQAAEEVLVRLYPGDTIEQNGIRKLADAWRTILTGSSGA